MELFDPSSYLIISAGIFAGAVVSGFVGFAFSAVAGAFLLHLLPPTQAVPLMMACSIITQVTSLIALRGNVSWRGNPLLIAGGLIGVLPALYLLHHVDTAVFRIGFGAFLVIYASYMLFRPVVTVASAVPGALRHAMVGFGGGLVGGLTAMPGALPTIWCELRGTSKDQQRGLVQPYIAAMQLFALAIMFSHSGSFSAQTLRDLASLLPALAAGVALGLIMYRRVNDTMFRRIVLVVLACSGALLAM